MIALARPSQIKQIHALTQACGEKMNAEGIFQWSETYPNFGVFQNDIERGELYVFMSEEKVVGCIVISTKMDEEYKTVNWLSQTSDHYYIHRLAVHPSYQGNGIARRLMDFAEDMAVENNKVSIRLDTFSQNLRNQKFYQARGYKRLGSIYFPKQSEFPFYCYELLLPTKNLTS